LKIIIIGAGDVGSFLANELSGRSEDVIVVDTDAKALERVEETTDVMTLKGNGTYRKTLAEIGVSSADLVVGVTSQDNTNLVIASLANSMGARRTVARVDAPEFFLSNGGIERNVLGSFAIICASRLVSAELLRLVRKIDMPYVENFSANSISVALINVNENCRYLEKSGGQLDVGKNAQVIGIFREGELRRPDEIAHLYHGDRILIASALDELPKVMKRIVQIPAKKAVIIGGGDVGFQLAKSLQGAESRLSIIDVDRKRCNFLAERLDRATIIHGDGTSLALLQEEHVEMADYIMAVTKADEVNLMSSLVSQEIGVTNSYTLVHRPGYAHVYEHLGIKGTASAHELISKAVNKYFPNQIILTESNIPHTDFLVGEFQIPYTVQSKNLRITDINIPMGSQLIGISRNEEFYFTDSSSEILAGDVLIIVCRRKELQTFEHMLSKLK
jgi:trk system potassium uptake protein